MDSTTMLYDHADSIALAVTFHYGSNHNEREAVCAAFGKPGSYCKHDAVAKRHYRSFHIGVGIMALVNPDSTGFKFTDVKVVKTTPIRDQNQSGTCWCFSTRWTDDGLAL